MLIECQHYGRMLRSRRARPYNIAKCYRSVTSREESLRVELESKKWAIYYQCLWQLWIRPHSPREGRESSDLRIPVTCTGAHLTAGRHYYNIHRSEYCWYWVFGVEVEIIDESALGVHLYDITDRRHYHAINNTIYLIPGRSGFCFLRGLLLRALTMVLAWWLAFCGVCYSGVRAFFCFLLQKLEMLLWAGPAENSYFVRSVIINHDEVAEA